MNINQKIKKLRQIMNQKNIDAYIIPSSDSHQSEYTGEHFKSRQWISGFTGSAGTVVVTKDKALLWTDGRYFLQAEEELKHSEIILCKMGEKNTPSINIYLRDNLDSGQIVGFDGRLFSYKEVATMKKIFKQKNIVLNTQYDLIDSIWTNRPELPSEKVLVHSERYSGKSVKSKLEAVRCEMREKDLDYYLVSSLDDIAWIYNIRGNDIIYNPVTIAFALIDIDEATIFISEKKLNSDVKEYLTDNDITIKDYSCINSTLKNLPKDSVIYFDSKKISISLYKEIPKSVRKLVGQDIIEKLKAIKNDVEIDCFKRCQIRDGVAMVKFLYWLDLNVSGGDITELRASEKLEEFRAEGENYISPSFETIMGYKDHGAIVHYSVDKVTDYKLKPESFLLVDSGAQYLDGTTDITRTIALGDISEEEKRDFTLVLKGHIALSSAKFLYGTTGTQLDILARAPLWEEGKDYKHGTGHGIGFFLSVHEGPQSISPLYNKTKLEPGMLITNEPGFYKSGEYGIRTENILLVQKYRETEYGVFLEFRNTTLCPIDIRAIKKELLSCEEVEWINNYHKEVYKVLESNLDKEISDWLKNKTQKI